MAEVRVGVRELKARLSEYMRRVKAGDVLIITERGQDVARVVASGRTLEERMHDLNQAGVIRWSGKRLTPARPRARLKGGLSIADLILEDRR